MIVALFLGVGFDLLLSPQNGWVSKATSDVLGNWLALPGILFLKLVQMIMIPLIVASIITGIASILIAFAIPGKVKIHEEEYLRDLNKLYVNFIKARSIKGNFISEKQLSISEEIKSKSDDAETPLQKIEYALSPK